MLCYQVLFKCSSSTLLLLNLPPGGWRKEAFAFAMEIYWCDVFQCPWEARSLKPVTSMSMSEVLHDLLLNLESIQQVMIWRAGIWHKDNEKEQSWHVEIHSKQKLFISESRGTHKVNGKLSQIPHSGSLRTTLTHLANVERVAVPKPRGVVKAGVKSLTGAQRSQQRNLIAVLGTCEYRGCKQHTWR